jgi:tRNA-binding EMAP/Myf-like protein
MSSSDDAAAPAASATASGEITADELAQLQALDLRVGRIISCEQHPDADRCVQLQQDWNAAVIHAAMLCSTARGTATE